MDEKLRKAWVKMAIRESSTQSKLALTALDLACKAPSTDIAFVTLQAFLSHCANVSKMLQAEQEPRPISKYQFGWRTAYGWLRRLGIVRTGPTVGDLLAIKKSSPIHREGRQFRNNLEHYDQRLFKWLNEHDLNIGIGDYNVMPKSMIKAPKGSFLFVRNFDPGKMTFTFVDKDLDVGVLRRELQAVKAAADKYLADNKMA